MAGTFRRIAHIVAIGAASMSYAAVVTPAIGSAAECGPGTFYDAPTNSCIAVPPPAQPAPPPAWNGDLTPYFSVGICAPIPFVSLCTGI